MFFGQPYTPTDCNTVQSTILNFTCIVYFIRLLIFGQGIVHKRTIFIFTDDGNKYDTWNTDLSASEKAHSSSCQLPQLMRMTMTMTSRHNRTIHWDFHREQQKHDNNCTQLGSSFVYSRAIRGRKSQEIRGLQHPLYANVFQLREFEEIFFEICAK